LLKPFIVIKKEETDQHFEEICKVSHFCAFITLLNESNDLKTRAIGEL